MELVKIDNSEYINVDRIDAIYGHGPNETHVFAGGSEEPFVFSQPIKKVLDDIYSNIEDASAYNDGKKLFLKVK